jgi:hypothetical protein
MLLKLIKPFVPELFVFTYPPGHLSKRLGAKRNQDFTTLPPALDESCSFEHLEMLGDRVQGCVERLGYVEKSSRSTGEPRQDRSALGVGNGSQNMGQLIQDHITP